MNLIDVIEPMEIMDMESTSPRKIILWGQDNLLSRSIMGLFLESNMTWDVIRVTREEGVGDLIEEIERIKPEVVILCEDKFNGKSTLPSLLINEQYCPKVVAVSLESNLMQVYSRHNIILQGASDLLSIVESSNFINCKSGKEVNG